MELDLQSLFGLLCTAVLIGWDLVTPTLYPRLGSYTRALLVSQDRRHLFRLCNPLPEAFPDCCVRVSMVFHLSTSNLKRFCWVSRRITLSEICTVLTQVKVAFSRIINPCSTVLHISNFLRLEKAFTRIQWVRKVCRSALQWLVRIRYKCLVAIYVFPEMKLRGHVIFKTEL